MAKVLLQSRILTNSAEGLALDHISSDGSSHSFINQSVTTTATPTFTGLSANSSRITSVATPTASTDAATKDYVDTEISGISTSFKTPVRVATTAAGTLASSFENGDTIDGITLATDNRILIKDQATGAENGIYTVNASGAPTRATDLAAADTAGGVVVSVQEGTVNADRLFVCTNDSGSDVVATDALVWETTIGLGTATFHVNTIAQFNTAISGIPAAGGRIVVAPGTYLVSTSVTVPANTVIQGSGRNVTIFQQSSLTGSIFIMSGANSVLRNMQLDFDNVTQAGANDPGITISADDNLLENCNLLNFAEDNTQPGIGITAAADRTSIINCLFNSFAAGTRSIESAGNDLLIAHCKFDNGGIIPINLTAGTGIKIIGCNIKTDLLGAIYILVASTGVIIDSNCLIQDGTFQTGISVSSASDVLISNNYIEGFTTCVNNSSAETLITGNIITNGTTTGINVSAKTTVVGNNLDGNVTAISVGASNGPGTLIANNNFVGNTTPITINATGNDQVRIINNEILESVTSAGTLGVYVSRALVTTGAGALALTIPDLHLGSAGHKLYLELDTDGGGDLTATPTTTHTNFATAGAVATYTSITFDDQGEVAILEWNGVGWDIRGTSGTLTVNA